MSNTRGGQQAASPSLASLNIRTLAATFSRQSLGYWVVCFYLIFEYVRPQSVWPVIDILPYAQIFIIAGVMLAFGEISKAGATKSKFNVYIMIYTAIVLLSSLLAYDSRSAFLAVPDFLAWVLVYFMIVNTVNTRNRWYLFFLLFLLCSFKMSQHGFRSWAGRGFEAEDWGVTGAPGFFHNSGEVGIQMCIFLPLCIVFAQQLWRKTGAVGKVFLFLMPVTAAGTVIASNSRGAVLGAIAALVFLIPKGARLRGAMLLLIAIVVGYVVMPDESLQRFAGIGSDSTSMSRITFWKNGIDMMIDHPLLGVGFGNWLAYYGDIYGAAGYLVLEPHNIFIEAGAQLGFSGLIILMLMIWITFKTNFETRRMAVLSHDEFISSVANGLNAAMIGFVVSGQFVTVLYYPYFWIGSALAISLNGAIKRASIVDSSTNIVRNRAVRSTKTT